MFERFTEDARRSLFFARARTSERNGVDLNSEDLLWGIVAAAPDVVLRCATVPANLPPAESGEQWIERLEEDPSVWADTSRDVRFSRAAQLALERAVHEADALGHKAVAPEHLLLGILRDESTEAWRTLHDAGVSLRAIRTALADEGEPPSRR